MSGWVISPAAARDLESVVDYISLEQRQPEAARRLLDEFMEVFDMLAGSPNAGRVRPELTSAAVRWWRLHRFLIAYEPGKPVRILRVIHGAREIEALVGS
ncbi:MAG: type II toxin-antitoxin system RelE/ParE family toxin [Phycisphaerales bacterium JB050]